MDIGFFKQNKAIQRKLKLLDLDFPLPGFQRHPRRTCDDVLNLAIT